MYILTINLSQTPCLFLKYKTGISMIVKVTRPADVSDHRIHPVFCLQVGICLNNPSYMWYSSQYTYMYMYVHDHPTREISCKSLAWQPCGSFLSLLDRIYTSLGWLYYSYQVSVLYFLPCKGFFCWALYHI